MDPRDPSARVWDGEWTRAWKAHPDNVWFAYEAGVYLDQLGDRGGRGAVRALKTDAFDEACGRRQLTAALGRDVVVVDVAPQTMRQAARVPAIDIVPCVADVRCLPFAPGAFDLILSTSTLDHFEQRADIDVALGELRRILRDDGRLLVTLDNPANPILRLRQAVHGLTGAVAGIIPFRMGLTLSRSALVEAVERAGFEVSESGYLVHAPRILALWVGEWAARGQNRATGRRLGAIFAAVERGLRRVPTRRWTAHFVFVDCRPRRASPGDRAPVPRERRGLSRWLTSWKVAEQRLRCAYLRWMPVPVLARVDPPLRRLATGVRRAAAVPLYTRHALTPWTGRCAETTGRVAVWSSGQTRALLLDVLVDDPPIPATRAAPVYGVRSLATHGAALAADCDVLIADTTPLLAPLFRRAGFHVVPAMVRFGGEPGVLLAGIARRPAGLVADLQRLKHSDYRVEVWSHTAERSRLFYHRYLVPHAQARFGVDAEIPSFSHVDGLFAAGCLLALVRPGAREPDAIGLVILRGAVLWCVVLGTRDADHKILRAGGVAGVYRAQIALAGERGARLVDFGRCLPWASNGVFQYKWKWGLRPIPDGTQTLEYAVKVLRPESAVARRLVERGVVVREGRAYRRFAADDLSVR